MDMSLSDVAELGKQLRVDSIRCTTAAGSGHPTSSMSAADLMAVLLARFLQYDWDEPRSPRNDRLVFSKGHASPLLYAMYKAVGVISDAELLSLRTLDSRLEGHPKPAQSGADRREVRGLPWVDVATGSLGQGLPIGVGMALAGKHIDKRPFHVWVLLGDSELAEGSVWEAEAYREACRQTAQPTCVIARTVKGSGASLVADQEGWHGKALEAQQAQQAIQELGGERHRIVPRRAPAAADLDTAPGPVPQPLRLPVYDVGTSEAFLTRAYDQIRMAAVSAASIRVCGSHAGVSIGEDGPSQMALEDLAMMRAVYGSTVLYPCDANQTARLVQAMAEWPGVSYLRTTRAKTPIIYDASEEFLIGGSRLVRHSDADRVAIVAAGVTLHESLRAYEQLQAEGIRVRVIDAYSVKPIDLTTLHDAARVTDGKLVVVEDHWWEGGLGDAVLNAFVDVGPPLPTVVKLAVRSMPTSGTPAELLHVAAIDAEHVVRAVHACL
jgi:transketolase